MSTRPNPERAARRLQRARAELHRAESAIVRKRTELSLESYAGYGAVLRSVQGLQADAAAMADDSIVILVARVCALEPHDRARTRRLLKDINAYLHRTINSREPLSERVVALRNGLRALASWQGARKAIKGGTTT